MPKSLPSAKEASWRQIVDEYASSGRSAKEFCLLKAISLRMFYCWRRKIALKDQGVVPLVKRQRKDDHRELAIVPLAYRAKPACGVKVFNPEGRQRRLGGATLEKNKCRKQRPKSYSAAMRYLNSAILCG